MHKFIFIGHYVIRLDGGRRTIKRQSVLPKVGFEDDNR